MVASKTGIGRVTVEALHMNRTAAVLIRTMEARINAL